MWTRFAAHLDEASWRYGRPRQADAPREETWRCLGDFEKGPWIYIIERAAGLEVRPHNHNEDEIVYILEGGLTHEGRWCGPGTVLSFPRRVTYGFTVGPEGVKWLMVRTGPSDEETADDWADHQGRTFEEYRAARAQRSPAARPG
jgi:hypothetical protein